MHACALACERELNKLRAKHAHASYSDSVKYYCSSLSAFADLGRAYDPYLHTGWYQYCIDYYYYRHSRLEPGTANV
jgi:hypothetical protein